MVIHAGMGSDLMSLCGIVEGTNGVDQVRLSYVYDQVTCDLCRNVLRSKSMSDSKFVSIELTPKMGIQLTPPPKIPDEVLVNWDVYPPVVLIPIEKILCIYYTNYEGKTAWRRVLPLTQSNPVFGTSYHPNEWCLEMWDVDKGATRHFCLKDITTIRKYDVTVDPYIRD